MSVFVAGDIVRRSVRVTGLVQGVGFRPFVHQLATSAGLSGFVGNDDAGVFAEVEGSSVVLDAFLSALLKGAPPLARVDRVDSVEQAPTGDEGFTIVESRVTGKARTYVAPDAAVCGDCLRELFDPADRRYRYPFITCTNCGPRFTITLALPYDRSTTTMAGFDLCPECEAQYTDPADRRFHAQPLACAACGPTVWLDGHDGIVEGAARGSDAAIAAAQHLLAAGAVVAVKGLGGYHLACDARSPDAVERLRQRKHRPDKPFAVMAPDLDACRRLAFVDDEEAAQLSSPARPIVLLHARPGNGLAEGVAPGNPLIGVVLPYTPLHHLLFARVPGVASAADRPVPDVLVMTSGNLSDEPICFEDDDARVRLGAIADAFLVHNRPIHVPCDDSVVRLVDGAVIPFRRSRGYAPMPIRLPVETGSLLAVGGELKNTFCIARGADAWLSQHIGDMGSVATLSAFERSVAQFRSLYSIEPTAVTADLHPGYHTRSWAERADLGPVIGVQHHHAHLAALLAERGEPLDAEVIGFVFDGTGYGTDGTIWGGEILYGGYADVERAGHLRPVSLPGGDAAIRRPYRAALAHLWAAGIAWDPALPPVAAAAPGELEVLARQLERGFQCVPTTSMGRLFDAVASLLGIRHTVTYEAQAALELEDLAADVRASDVRASDVRALDVLLAPGEVTKDRYRFGLDDGSVIDPSPVWAALVADLRAGVATRVAAAAFHDAVAEVVAEAATIVRDRTGSTVVGLTGGVFQNAVLVSATRSRLVERGFRVLTHTLVPPNDGGLALGQAAVAAARSHTCNDPAQRED